MALHDSDIYTPLRFLQELNHLDVSTAWGAIVIYCTHHNKYVYGSDLYVAYEDWCVYHDVEPVPLAVFGRLAKTVLPFNRTRYGSRYTLPAPVQIPDL